MIKSFVHDRVPGTHFPVSGALIAALFALLGLSACAVPSSSVEPTPAAPPVPMTHCAAGDLRLDAHFDGGQLGQCEATADGGFKLTLYPEDTPPINVSPWYAFRVSGSAGDSLNVEMTVSEGYNRYWPKLSTDGVNWSRAPEAWVERDDDGQRMVLRTELTGPWLWVAGQELLTADWFRGWNAELNALPFASTRLAGASRQGRPIFVTETAPQRDYVLMIGRQHPPELTGSLNMRPFMDTVLGDTDLARRFRERFTLVIYPVLNPDGVALGHWRHNTGGVDLNRDWGPFTQPETRLVRDHVDALEAEGQTMRLMLDFHSTRKDLFYTQTAEEITNPEAFATNWMSASRERLPDFEFKHDPRPVSERPTTKNYFYTRFGIPAITVESGDETDRDAIERSAVVFAEEMMRLMLEAPVDR